MRKVAGLVLEVKGDFCRQVRDILQRHGRAEDYVEVSLESSYRYIRGLARVVSARLTWWPKKGIVYLCLKVAVFAAEHNRGWAVAGTIV